MFEKNAALFLYSVSPVHMGAGTATGVIDNPIQREVHTQHPSFAGSGLKGAIRHGFKALGGNPDQADQLFGPRQGDLHAGAVSLGDAQLVALPVRTRREGYAYATSPLALARLQRLLHQAGLQPEWTVPTLPQGEAARAPAAVTPEGLEALTADGGRLHLEVFELAAQAEPGVAAIGQWLAEHALSKDHGEYFRNKLARDLVILPETELNYFSRNAMVVEPHVRIDPKTGTADGSGLFYTENLPPESLLAAPVMASGDRSGERELDSAAVMAQLHTALDGNTLQIGGDATTGRGLVTARLVEKVS
ncbi:type III-B CRISPR module RAMP protein Cmr4 [Halorhodospira halophila]|uniref:CRISPR-associated protein, Cmr4 family n=1 Tax=Halorhodospira halophila (strain DSM 244 / SL1) TaxID=349124 RepID=A1WUQ2_HALHL|nr:type III-B CRISPR module RAMP protein Cmr4 [Halorhodospira halophila]ABM61414.1 CRISPR-associated protein, Cmr4 family [Halorhodospira halophila SL1]MBK1728656.1 type III-B CRISPR module RAMP protein Cmr4 [Halorhodospira halophila]